jgi:hypothetical protein
MTHPDALPDAPLPLDGRRGALPWHEDPYERARFLDGEGSADERAARSRDLDEMPAARARVEAGRRFLAVVRSGRAALPQPSDLLKARVRRALAADRAAGFPSTGAGEHRAQRRRVLGFAAAAAAVLVAVGWVAMSDRGTPTAEAQNIRRAALLYEEAVAGYVPTGPRDGAGGSCEEGPSSPLRFPIVTSGENSVAACAHEADAKVVALLRPKNDARSEKGLVVVPWSGKSSSTDVGFTRVKDVVVFDVAIGRAKYYLSVPWKSVEGTTMCLACHGPARADHPETNPHVFVQRTPLLLEAK